MARNNYENWWSKNLFSDKAEYEHLGNKVRLPSLEEFSDTWMGSINDKDRVKVRKSFKNYRSILDVGCGGSPEYYGINNKKIEYTGMDITPELVDFNKKKGINCIVGSANEIPFDDKSFDVVHSRHVIEHMPGFEKPISEMIRVSKHLVLISFFIEPIEGKSKISLDNKDTEYEIFHNQYSKDKIVELLEKNPRVKKFKFKKLPGFSTNLLKINTSR